MGFFDAMKTIADVVVDSVSLNYSKMKDEGAVKQKAAYFRKDYAQYFRGHPINSHITQTHWYLLHLNKKRLEQNGLSLELDLMPMSEDSSVYWESDGKYVLAHIDENVIVRRNYKLNNIKLQNTTKGEKANYIIVESLKQADTYICPNCGGESSMEQLLSGCEYCSTKFHLEDFQKKVQTFYLMENSISRMGYRAIKMRKLMIPYLILCGLIGLIPILSIVSLQEILSQGLFPQVVMSMVGSAIVGGFIGYGYYYLRGFIDYFFSTGSVNRKKGYTSNIERKMRKYDQYFSLESFIGNITNKVAGIHYAERTEHFSAFLKCNGDALLQRYKNVIECTVGKYELISHDVDSYNQVVKVKLDLNLLVLDKKKLKKKSEVVSMVMVRNKNVMAQAICEPKAYQCQGCGGSISLLNGGKCESCSMEMNLVDYDWVIADYKSYGMGLR